MVWYYIASMSTYITTKYYPQNPFANKIYIGSNRDKEPKMQEPMWGKITIELDM